MEGQQMSGRRGIEQAKGDEVVREMCMHQVGREGSGQEGKRERV